MNQDRKRETDMPTRSPKMEPAEGSPETVRESGKDLGTSSDRAMYSEDRSSNAGGITNRPLDREESAQQRLPKRGHSKSDAMPEDDTTLKTKI